jgi:hypothetical protein
MLYIYQNHTYNIASITNMDEISYYDPVAGRSMMNVEWGIGNE